MDVSLSEITQAGTGVVAAALAWIARSLVAVVRDHLAAEQKTKAAGVAALQSLADAANDAADTLYPTTERRQRRRPRRSGGHPSIAAAPPDTGH